MSHNASKEKRVNRPSTAQTRHESPHANKSQFDPYASQNVFNLTSCNKFTNQEENNPDLKIYVTDDAKEPNEHNSYMQFTNPQSKIVIKQKEVIQAAQDKEKGKTMQKKKKSSAQQEDIFNAKFIFISIYSMKGGPITLSCSFPNQPEIQQQAKGHDVAQMKKDMMSKFKLEIEEKIIEIENNLGGQREYFEYLSSIRQRREQAGLKNCDVNFIDRNIDQVQDFDNVKVRQKYTRELLQLKIEEAQKRKKEMEEQRLERSKFQMMKWDLYRKKCEQIEEAYSHFKKTQLKIYWWLQIILAHRSLKKSMWNFLEFRDIVQRQARELLMYNRIQFHFKRYIVKKGDPFRRYELPIRK